MINWTTQEYADGRILLFQLSGHLDTSSCDYLYEVLEGNIEDGKREIILDCNELEFISSMGLGMLMRIHSKMAKLGGNVRLCRVHGTIAEALRLVKFDKILRIFPSVESAVESFGE